MSGSSRDRSSSSKSKSKQTSDEILSDLFRSFKGEDGEAEEGEANSASSPSGSEEESYEKKHKKSKKAKKEKKKKKKKEKDRDKEKKKKHSSPQRKARPLSPPAKPGGLQSSLDEWDISSRKVSSREDYERRHRHEERDRDHHRSDNDHHHHREGQWPESDRGHRNDRNHHEDHRSGGGGNHWHDNDRDRRSNDKDYDRKHHNKYEDSRGSGGDRYQSKSRYEDSRGGDRHRDHHDHRDRDRGRDRSRDRDDRSDHHRSSRSTRQDEQRPPKRSSSNNEDSFWDSRWEGMEMQKKADALEKRGKHFLDEKREREAKIAAEKAKKRERSPSPETEELKRLKRMKEMQDLIVKEDEKYVAEPLDPKLFVWDDKVKMWKRRPEGTAPGDKPYEEELKERMDEQFEEGKRPKEETDDIKKEIKEEPEDDNDDKTSKKQQKEEAKMSLDEIEEVRKKREKFKEGKDKKNSDEKEDGEVNSEDEENSKRKSKSRRSRSRSRDRDSRSHTKSRRDSRSVSKDHRDKGRSHYRSRSRDRRRSRSRDRSDRRRSRSRSRDRHFTSFKSSRDGRGYREDRRERDRDRYSRSRRRSRTRSPRDSFRGSRSEIDKAKLLAIAKKNAVKLLTSDNLMGMDHDRLIAIKSGGQSLRQLTDFCREIAAKGITDEFDEDDDILYGNDNKDEAMHHPFEVKDRAIPNPFSSSGVAAEKLTPAMKSAAMSHRMIEFPVSSGNSHRVKEVEVKDEFVIPSAPDEIKLAIEDKSNEEADAAAKVAEINKANPLGLIMFGGAVPDKPLALTMLEDKKEETESADQAEALAKLDEKTDNLLADLKAKSSFQDPLLPQARSKPVDSVFAPVAEPRSDISSIVKQRLDAQKKLEENPNDSDALAKLYDAQKEMEKWAESKNKPGQFTGTTGAKILTHAELSTGVQAWAKNEQFTNAKKVQGGFGEFLLKKMGWSEGDGLGKTRSGDVDPLTLDIKMDKKGLMSAEENTKNKRGAAATLTGCKDLSHKHPVSGLMELSTKRKWGPPNFVQLFDVGPPHKKQYIFKVVVNGVDYQPTVASDNKKKAKADAATVALIKMGLLEKDPNNPL